MCYIVAYSSCLYFFRKKLKFWHDWHWLLAYFKAPDNTQCLDILQCTRLVMSRHYAISIANVWTLKVQVEENWVKGKKPTVLVLEHFWGFTIQYLKARINTCKLVVWTTRQWKNHDKIKIYLNFKHFSWKVPIYNQCREWTSYMNTIAKYRAIVGCMHVANGLHRRRKTLFGQKQKIPNRRS